MLDLKSYLLGKHGGAYTPSADLPSYLMGKAKSGGIQEITGTLPPRCPFSCFASAEELPYIR